MSGQSHHDFDWVQALSDCSVQFEFSKLKLSVKKDVKQRNSHYGNSHVKWDACEDLSMIQVSRVEQSEKSRQHPCVEFVSDGACIVVKGSVHEEQFCLTLTLNDKGKCRFRINGKGQYKRWQVIRRALEPLFFSFR